MDRSVWMELGYGLDALTKLFIESWALTYVNSSQVLAGVGA